MIEATAKRKRNLMAQAGWVTVLVCGAAPLLFLVILSSGTGWTYPRLTPDRIDFAPWSRFFESRTQTGTAALTSLTLCIPVGCLSTLGGLLLSRQSRRFRSGWLIGMCYLPFVISPVIFASCLYDFAVRTQLAGTPLGVILCQMVIGVGFAAVLFHQFWDQRIDRYESLVQSLGGSSWDRWRHGIWPAARGLIVICLIQTTLFSWLDYGVVSTIGGGNVITLTVVLFGYLRQGGVNQAAQAGLVLMMPSLLALAATAIVVTTMRKRTRRGVST